MFIVKRYLKEIRLLVYIQSVLFLAGATYFYGGIRFPSDISFATLTILFVLLVFAFSKKYDWSEKYSFLFTVVFSVITLGPLLGVFFALVLEYAYVYSLLKWGKRDEVKYTTLGVNSDFQAVAIFAVSVSWLGNFALVNFSPMMFSAFFAILGALLTKYLYSTIFDTSKAARTIEEQNDLFLLAAVVMLVSFSALSISYMSGIASFILLLATLSVVSFSRKRLAYSTVEAFLDSYAEGVESIFFESKGASSRISDLARSIGEACSLPLSELKTLQLAPRLSYLAWLRFPKMSYLKGDELAEEEKTKLVLSMKVLKKILTDAGFPEIVRNTVFSLYERFDGSGFPEGLKGSDIPKTARIIAVAEAYDRVTSWRPNSETLSDELAFEHLEKMSGVKLDPEIVSTLKQVTRGTTSSEEAITGENASENEDKKRTNLKTILKEKARYKG